MIFVRGRGDISGGSMHLTSGKANVKTIKKMSEGKRRLNPKREEKRKQISNHRTSGRTT